MLFAIFALLIERNRTVTRLLRLKFVTLNKCCVILICLCVYIMLFLMKSVRLYNNYKHNDAGVKREPNMIALC